ncbi:phenol hydroxylase [Halarcobacter mediterraneus]|uniref:Phenol hydroxylase n=1 Tax=Halarcobacter mediterraneus TaxID=2023153 RepID=A0A4Q1B012_9BACT|nr:phenol hydroxylase subunit P4 [Halarcobacter mediterraneus]RXK13399.1 phenol hydroxylase [Halarcobacter mediterraneus]
MSIKSIGEYPIIMKDSVENFNGNQVVYLYWYGHRVVSSPRAFPLPPEMPFGAIISDLIPITYKVEPDYEDLDFENLEVIWEVDGKVIEPDFSKSLKENGVGHKSFIQFTTPTLTGKVGA